MTSNSRVSVVTLIVGLALMLGACGSKGPASSTTDTAQVTFQSEPVAEVWIDGKASGSTPLAVPLSAGSHEVSLKRAGFTDLSETVTVEAGKDITLSGTLPVAGEDEAALRRMIAMVGEEHEPLAKATTHRGGGSSVTLYYPMGDVRRSGLDTYRIEVDGSYDYEGYIEFRRGSKVLYREKFEPAGFITEKALPPEVLEAARNGRDLSWGLTYDNKRRKKDEVLAKFDVISSGREKKVNKSLEKMAKHKSYVTASPLLQEMSEIEQLKRYRLYSEVLVRSLGVLNAWQETELPYANMVDVMTRLKLKDSSLYQFAASKVSGAGGMRLVKGGEDAVTNKTRNKGSGSAGGALGDAATGSGMAKVTLPPVAVAPPSKRAGSKSMGPGGLGVTPTDSGSRAKSGATPAEGAAPDGTGSDAGGQDARGQRDPRTDQLSEEVRVLKDELREADLKAARAADAEESVAALRNALDEMGPKAADAQQELEVAEKAAEAADQALRDLESSPAPDAAAIEAARSAADSARQAADDAAARAADLNRQREQMEQDLPREERKLAKILKETGGAASAADEADKIRKRIAAKEEKLEALRGEGSGTVGSGTPNSAGGVQPLDARGTQLSQEIQTLKDGVREAEMNASRAAEAEKALAALQGGIDAMGPKIADAQQALEGADKAAADAEEVLNDLETTGAPAADVEAARAAAETARNAANEAAAAADELNRQLQQMEEERPREERKLTKAIEQAGGPSAATAAEAERLRRRLAAKESEAKDLPPSSNVGGTPGTNGAVEPAAQLTKAERQEQRQLSLRLAQETLTSAQRGFTQAESFRDSLRTEFDNANSQRDAAEAAYKAAQDALPLAHQDFAAKRQAHEDLVEGGGASQSQIEAAKAAMESAEQATHAAERAYRAAEAERASAEANAARAAIEQERASAAAQRAKLELDEATAALEQAKR